MRSEQLLELARQACHPHEKSIFASPWGEQWVVKFGESVAAAERKGTGMTDLRSAAQMALAFTLRDFASVRDFQAARAVVHGALKAALAQEEQATVKESLQVPQNIAAGLTAADLAWLETRRLVRVWEELGQMRWAGADEGWDKAIEAVRNRLDKECQDVLAWKQKVEASAETAVQLLQRMRNE